MMITCAYLLSGDDDEVKQLNEDDENYDADEDMMNLLGFSGFNSTKVSLLFPRRFQISYNQLLIRESPWKITWSARLQERSRSIRSEFIVSI